VSELTDKQQEFVENYCVNFDATNAAIKAKYSKKSAMAQGCQLLKNPKVRKAILERLEEYGKQRSILKQRVLNFLAEAAFSDITEFADIDADGVTLKNFNDLPKPLRMLVQEVQEVNKEKGRDVKFKLVDKMKALELIGKHLAMFTDVVEHHEYKPTIIQRRDGSVIELTATKQDADKFEDKG
jgi:phage terminase small subunit